MDEKTAKIFRDTPLRLDVALKLAFPAGGLTVKGLRKEIEKGRLEVELIANKQFTTLAAIERMRELCKVPSRTIRSHETPSQCDVLPDREDRNGESDLQRLIRVTREKSRAIRRDQRVQKRKGTT
ncbi:excisionase [Bradyrhizobium sp. CCBAU 51627]|uniref:excisionase n=1 Tax=Bradyrhizobium sp. CCBAU 51627 TaxID=1325088 RepID=UPI0023055AFB|nr:excisionase [Bradyrhizobium sp. CCBAU 51627]